ncbi:hypothetical protein PRSY57_0312700 [Plasmodium reichenowi]|uniref:ATPase AAA-type core domain-containing protein n=1 Tax=Plasmodium reichenowi TaxID=5854 RepID=A0A151LTX6_PLARE|nr:hypothetical protein PRSY57_0312700 [Plasmodium reichenowi]KYO02622.1 hypothetical protein PRSY57_0312700 [Plasmodium reichenowi]
MTFERLKNFYDIFQKDIEELKFPEELVKVNNPKLKDENIIYYKKWDYREKNVTYPTSYRKNEKTDMKENISINEKKRFIFLLSSVGKELLLDNLLTTSRDKKKENDHIFGNNFLVISKESNNNYLTLVNTNNNYIYALIVRNPNIFIDHIYCPTKGNEKNEKNEKYEKNEKNVENEKCEQNVQNVENEKWEQNVQNVENEKWEQNVQNVQNEKWEKYEKNVKYSFVYSLYKHYNEEVKKKKKYKNTLDYYINVNFVKEKFKLLKINTINISDLIWNLQFSKELLKNKITNLNHGNFLCYIICPNVLNKEYKLYLYNIIKNEKKKKKSLTDTIFYIVEENDKYLHDVPRKEKKIYGKYKEEEVEKKNKRYNNSDDKKGSDYEHVNLYNKEDKTLTTLQYKNKKIPTSHDKLNKHNITFYKHISSILNLLHEENELYLHMYNLETYTRIFIYNCEEMNKIHFFHFLKKKYKNFYIHIVNLNTLFGIYFNETERNILKVFNKCKYILKKNIYKNVFLIIDGIDIVANNVQNQLINDNDHDKHNYFKKKYINILNDEKERNNVPLSPSSSPNQNNDHSRILTTLLLCLDSIDTIKKENKKNTKIKIKIKTNINERHKPKYNPQQNKEHISNLSLESDHYSSSDFFEKGSHDTYLFKNSTKERNKTKKTSNCLITYDFKNLQQIYKEKCIELKKKKTTNNISVIMLSDVHMNLYNISLTRAGRFFHFINYLSEV